MTKKTRYLCLMMLVLGMTASIAGCSVLGPESLPQPMAGNGTIQLLQMEKDIYNIIADDGARYYPLYLPDSFRSDGMRVAYTIQANTTTGKMPGIGVPVDVIELVALSPPGSMIAATGKVRYVDLEGGFYGITVDKGKQYGTVDFFPINLADQYKVNNSMIRFTGVPQRDIVTTTMWGIPIQIIDAEQI
jgi:predicted small lipoprotein YifL